MAGRNAAIFGIYSSRADVDRAVEILRGEGYRSTDISLLLPQNSGMKDFAGIDKSMGAEEGSDAGAETEFMTEPPAGGILGWLTGVDVLVIPGIGPFIAAGPVMTALAGATGGHAAGTFVDLGVPQHEAKEYEGRMKEGGILLSVHCDNSKWTRKAKDILARTGAEAVTSTHEAKADTRDTARPLKKTGSY